MIIPIKCFTCGMVIADKYRYYTEEVRRQKLIKSDTIDKVLYLTKDYHEKTIGGRVLDDLFITKMCCRRHFFTHVEIE